MNISKLKLVWLWLIGGKERVLDYVIDVANSSVRELEAENKEAVTVALYRAKKVLNALDGLDWLVPSKWREAFAATTTALADVIEVCGDLEVTREEITAVIQAWEYAFSKWRA